MHQFRQRLIHLHSCRGVNWRLLFFILQKDPHLKHIFQTSVINLKQQYSLSSRRATQLWDDLHAYTSEQIEQYYKRNKIVPITFFDRHYPPLLKHIPDPPFVLYAKGKVEWLRSKNSIAMIGSRRPSKNGLQTVQYLLPSLVQKDWKIVSGFARGIDTKAHVETMRLQGKTIAVLGSGFQYVYPRENEALFAKMSKEQLLITEYPPYVPPKKWHFPERNRIISGLSEAVIVVEAKKRSGTLITVDQALEQGRDVFAVPGSILDERFAGTNQLIQEGAKLVQNAEDILHEL